MKPSKDDQEPPREKPDDAEETAQAEKLQQLLLQLWITNKPTVAERLGTIRLALSSMQKASLDDKTRLNAREAAHKLAGILGTFGLPKGTELAREVELAMEQATNKTSPDTTRLAASLDAMLRQLTALIEQKSCEIPPPAPHS